MINLIIVVLLGVVLGCVFTSVVDTVEEYANKKLK